VNTVRKNLNRSYIVPRMEEELAAALIMLGCCLGLLLAKGLLGLYSSYRVRKGSEGLLQEDIEKN
jgi:hypothetical protein